MESSHPSQTIYDDLWRQALRSFDAGQVQIDPFLVERASDERNGLSLIFRIQMTPTLRYFLRQLRRTAPTQYHYPFSDLHVTVLTLIPVQEKRHFSPDLLHQFDAALSPVFRRTTPFVFSLQGITASPNTVMLQGYATHSLNRFRTNARAALAQAGLAEGVDSRYKLVASHVTVMRFLNRPRRLKRVVDFLGRMRANNTFFGVFPVHQVLLTDNDYFMQRHKTIVLHEYHF